MEVTIEEEFYRFVFSCLLAILVMLLVCFVAAQFEEPIHKKITTKKGCLQFYVADTALDTPIVIAMQQSSYQFYFGARFNDIKHPIYLKIQSSIFIQFIISNEYNECKNDPVLSMTKADQWVKKDGNTDTHVYCHKSTIMDNYFDSHRQCASILIHVQNPTNETLHMELCPWQSMRCYRFVSPPTEYTCIPSYQEGHFHISASENKPSQFEDMPETNKDATRNDSEDMPETNKDPTSDDSEDMSKHGDNAGSEPPNDDGSATREVLLESASKPFPYDLQPSIIIDEAGFVDDKVLAGIFNTLQERYYVMTTPPSSGSFFQDQLDAALKRRQESQKDPMLQIMPVA